MENDKLTEKGLMKYKILNNAKCLTKGHSGDAGVDLALNSDIEILPNSSTVICTGICVQIPKGSCGIIFPRSSIMLSNVYIGQGLIDPGYIGEIKIFFHNYGKEAFIRRKGDRIAQICFVKFLNITELIQVDELESEERGQDGFGSTGS